CEASLVRIAKKTRSVAFLYMRSGLEFVCASRVGNVATRALSIDVGTRRALVLSSGGAAILAALPRDEARAAIAANIARIKGMGSARIAGVNAMLQRSAQHKSLGKGVGVNLEDIVPGINSIGVAICSAQGNPFASICVTAPAK